MAENDPVVVSQTVKPEASTLEMIKANSTSFHAKLFGPLGLPEGSVRAIMVVSTLLTFLYMVATKDYVPEKLWSLVTLMIGWYFLTRNQKPTGGELK